MKIVVPVQVVPDRVEEIPINSKASGFELEDVTWILNEFDDHAIEQGVLLKEKLGAELVVIAAGGESAEEGLFTAAAKGADRLVKARVDFTVDAVNNHALARIFKTIIEAEKPDLVLTGVSNYNGFDGSVGPFLAEYLGLPYIGYVSGVSIEGNSVHVMKDYPGGVKVKLAADLPAMLGISAAEQPPRYVPISKVRQAMKTSALEEADGELDLSGGLNIDRMYEPEKGGRAEILKGKLGEIADRVAAIIKSKGLI